MTYSKHTPAPWAVRFKHHDKCDYLPERDTYNACKDGKPLTNEGEEGKANAHLIASAPELLEALEMAMQYGAPSEEMWHNFKILANKAIAKARAEV